MTNTAQTQNTQQQRNTVLVLGGTGKTGRRVAERLTALGLPVRIGSRGAAIPFDWNDDSTWAPALESVGSVYLTYYPDLAFPGAKEHISTFAHLAARSGVRRIVVLSGRGEKEAVPSERAVQDSGVECTVLRASWFSQNFSEHFLLEPVLGGVIALPAGEVAEPFIDVDDIADVAVAALTEDGHVGRTYDLTGPRLLTFADAAAEIAKATGRTIDYVAVTAEEYAAGAEAHGVPAEEVAALTDLFTRVLDGRNAHVSDGVRRVLGREARDFADYARAAAATGVWHVWPAAADPQQETRKQ